MRKTVFILLFINNFVLAQAYTGDWHGSVQNTNGSLPAEMSLKVINNTMVEGRLSVLVNGMKDTYSLKGSVNAKGIAGTLTYTDGTIFNFSIESAQNQLRQEISYNGQIILQGNYTRQNKGVGSSGGLAKSDGLYRDPALIGKWASQENYSSNGGYYGGSSSTIILNADGSIDDGGSSSYISGPGSSGRSEGGGNKMIEEAKAIGARWYTKGNIFYWRLTIDGKTTDVANSKYYIEKNALLLTDLKTGKKQLYYKK